MPNLNTRNVPEELYRRVRLAAACGGERIPKGALERFVIQALRRAVEDPRPGAGMARLRLCLPCIAKNSATLAGKVPQLNGKVPMSAVETRQGVVEPVVAGPAVELFSHLLTEDAESGAVAGMGGIPLPVPAEGVEGLKAAYEKPQSRIETLATEVTPGLWVGSDSIFFLDFQPAAVAGTGWSILSAAKEPWHRQMVGYQTKSAPEGAERLVARRGQHMAHMALNLIDVRELGPGGHHYVAEEAVEAGLAFIGDRLTAGDQVLVHSNQGQSAAPALALLWMWRTGLLPQDAPLPAFATLYEKFLPSAGMGEYLRIKLAAEGGNDGNL